jgi:O-antigen/teichoic acid export membrane protein
MRISDNTIKTINDVATPFAVAAIFLFFALVLLESFRRGSVSDFLDLRAVAALVVVFGVASALTVREQKNNRWEKIFIASVLIFAAYAIINIALPFGRLGLVVIGCGALTLAAVFILVAKNMKHET